MNNPFSKTKKLYHWGRIEEQDRVKGGKRRTHQRRYGRRHLKYHGSSPGKAKGQIDSSLRKNKRWNKSGCKRQKDLPRKDSGHRQLRRGWI